jgi:tetratricopeptide (TPR) repeat protein
VLTLAEFILLEGDIINMNNLKNKILKLFLSLALASCASTGSVIIESNPIDANVFWLDTKSGQSSLIGKTPLTFSKDLAKEKGSDVFQLKIEKEGFESKHTSVASFGHETTFLNIQLSSVHSANAELKKAFEVNRELLSEATRLASVKRFSEALSRVEKILQTDPKNDEAHAAKGSLLYLMKDYDGAETSWKKSLEINPANDIVRASIVDLHLTVESAADRMPAINKQESN